MFKRIAALLAMALAFGFAAVTPAHADGAAPGFLTGFDGGIFSTALISLNPKYYSPGQCVDTDPIYDNRVSSVLNSSFTVSWTAFTTDTCSGSSQTFPHNTQAVLSGTMNNNIESFRRN